MDTKEMILQIRECFQKDKALYSRHAHFEMSHEEFGAITDKEVGEAILSGTIIQQYLDDRPYPSFLVSGKTNEGRPLHMVCALDEAEGLVIVVTVYHPNPRLWVENRERRKP